MQSATGAEVGMPTFVVERSLPGLTVQHLPALQNALAEATTRLTSSGSPVTYRGTTFLPARSRCFCLFEAASVEVVKRANETAQIPFVAVTEAIELPGPATRL